MKAPELRVNKNGTRVWYLKGKLHREDGPAVERADGSKEWRLNGNLHRTDGPAMEWPNGYRAWYINGKRHRKDGPAKDRANGDKEWWIKGKQLSKGDFKSLEQIIKMRAFDLFTPQEIVRMRNEA